MMDLKNRTQSLPRLSTFVFLFSFCILFFPASPPSAQPAFPGVHEPVEVARVIDGDTVELVGGERVRYLGIDAPETHRKINGRWIRVDEPFSDKAFEYNRMRVKGEKVRLEFDRKARDRFNRLLAYVFVDDEMVNLELIKKGLVRVSFLSPNLKYEKLFKETENDARTRGRGLWGLNP